MCQFLKSLVDTYGERPHDQTSAQTISLKEFPSCNCFHFKKLEAVLRCVGFFLNFFKIDLRERKGERGGEKNIHWLPSATPTPGMELIALPCVLSWNHMATFGPRDGTQPTEPQEPRQVYKF